MPIEPVSNQPVSRPEGGKAPTDPATKTGTARKVTSLNASGIADLISLATADGKPLDGRIAAAQKKQSGATKIAAALQVFMGGVKSIFDGSNRLPSTTQPGDQANTAQSAVRNLLRQLNIKV
jgi:hypothetical protein